jgi:hypothetical protein
LALICRACNATLTNDAKFCSQCAAPTTDAITVGGSLVPGHVQPTVVTQRDGVPAEPHPAPRQTGPDAEAGRGTGPRGCPSCDQVDAVRKVSAIYGAGTTESAGNTFGTAVSFGERGTEFTPFVAAHNTQSQTLLSKRLSPPKRPNDARLTCAIVGGLCVGFGGIWLFSAVPGAAEIGLAVGLLGAFLFFKLVDWSTAKDRLRWQEQMARWDRLFYCARCDGIFVPGEAGLAPLDELPRLLG